MLDLRRKLENVPAPRWEDPVNSHAEKIKTVREFGINQVGVRFTPEGLRQSVDLLIFFNPEAKEWASRAIQLKGSSINNEKEAKFEIVAGYWADRKLSRMQSHFEKQSFIDDMKQSIDQAKQATPQEQELIQNLEKVYSILKKIHGEEPIVDSLGQLYLFDKWKAD